MARKANIDNLIRDAKKIDDRIIEIEKMLETAKSDSASAWDKVSERKKELEQENNNGIANEVKDVFGEDITPAELSKELKYILLIDEVKEYIESEKVNRNAAAENKTNTENNSESDTTSDIDSKEILDYSPVDTTSDNPTL